MENVVSGRAALHGVQGIFCEGFSALLFFRPAMEKRRARRVGKPPIQAALMNWFRRVVWQ
ncbi:MAG: hypothetical protein LBG69_09585 [Zoogloeaceae bacterium]|jgi:hypothetical protein|nr:hypothetical protein [Zoogloeaceae bacterium]